ncbi:helix-turn-helix domain-containing protein [Lactobacillus kalixensis]|uniref:HTH cro/C1-type domain-containing protein n=1 Tax=Lactobacillus kalixensis DSM 16043 TaxID=1423763 RepID=A0A0R1U641_9LACO|nr:helix-turn-helix transcriptional regulator [Lactobacillus kalixensis]KRL88694.1 hypothetical protein FC46_GL001450 [Lactobacillus kalixensis DSM 16043]
MLLDRIKERAKKFDMSLQDIAEKTGISPNTIYSWRKKTPRIDKLQKVADVLHTSTDYLNGKTDNPNISDDINTKSADLADDDVLFTYQGKEIPAEDMDYIRGLLKRFDENHE